MADDEGEPLHMGSVTSLEFQGDLLVVKFEDDALMATGCPDWLLAMDEEARGRWKAVEGGLYWPEGGHTLRLVMPNVDPELLAKVMAEFAEDEG